MKMALELQEMIKQNDWTGISQYPELSETFIEKYADKVDWTLISEYQELSETFIERHADKVNWRFISEYQKLSEGFIEKHAKSVDWHNISIRQQLSESFIENYTGKVDWTLISAYQKLSEAFIEKHADKVNWNFISKYQGLSETFIKRHADKVNWRCIAKYQKLSEDFRKQYGIKTPENSWLYASNEEKLKAVKQHGYSVENGNVIAYKSCRANGYSIFNFQYRYEVGKTYTSHCDCNLGCNASFGLSAWTMERALNYCDEKLFKVSIPLEKLGAIAYGSKELRAFEMTILEEIG